MENKNADLSNDSFSTGAPAQVLLALVRLIINFMADPYEGPASDHGGQSARDRFRW